MLHASAFVYQHILGGVQHFAFEITQRLQGMNKARNIRNSPSSECRKYFIQIEWQYGLIQRGRYSHVSLHIP